MVHRNQRNMSQWNQLTDIFGCNRNNESIPECAADNIYIAWPSIIRCIKKEFDSTARQKVLDFGCGGGSFCCELFKMGFEVTGYDQSEELAQAAQVNTPEEITITDSSIIAEQKGKYDLITAIMVLQFIEDIDSAISNLLSILAPNGLFVYAVFNPKFIEENLDNSVFTGFKNSPTGYMELKKGIKIKCYNRTDSEHRSIFEKLGYEEVYIDYPEFTEEFLSKYKMPFSTQNSEYLIQAFRRNHTPIGIS